jgi:hypothetical protein
MKQASKSSLVENKEAKKLHSLWRLRPLRVTTVARRTESFLVLFFKKELLPCA